MSGQVSLFEVPNTARARRSDPATSWWAAQGIDVSKSEAWVLTALISGPATPHELWERIYEAGHTCTSQRVRTALSDMQRRDLVTPTGEYGLSENGGKSRLWRRCVR